MDVKVDDITTKEANDRLAEMLSYKSASIITTPNTEFIVAAQNNEEFKSILNEKSKLNLPDGTGILWAARFLYLQTPKDKFWRFLVILFQWIGTIVLIPFAPKYFRFPLHEKIGGADFIWQVAKIASSGKHKIFLLGGAATVAERTALKLQTDVENLRIAGVHSGTPKETEEIIEAINKSRADILLVCFGAPKQEKWLAENVSRTCCKVGIGLGGTFDFIAGERQRAPKWMQKSGLEWLFRLIIEPARIKRQLIIPKFMWLVLIEKLRNK